VRRATIDVGATAADTEVVGVFNFRAGADVGGLAVVVGAWSAIVVVGSIRTIVVVVLLVLRAFVAFLVVELGVGAVPPPGMVAPGGVVTGVVALGFVESGTDGCDGGLTTFATSSVGTTCADQLAGTVDVDAAGAVCGVDWASALVAANPVNPPNHTVNAPNHTVVDTRATLRNRSLWVRWALGPVNTDVCNNQITCLTPPRTQSGRCCLECVDTNYRDSIHGIERRSVEQRLNGFAHETGGRKPYADGILCRMWRESLGHSGQTRQLHNRHLMPES
jgi:hypothetical protein